MNVLIVDDDKLFVRKVVEIVNWEKLDINRVFTAENMQQACGILQTFPVDIVITDVEMSGGNGLELLNWISENELSVETVVVSGYAHFAYAQKAMEYGCKRYLLKPVSGKELSTILEEIIAKQRKLYKSNSFVDNLKKFENTEDISFYQELFNMSVDVPQSQQFVIVVLKLFSEMDSRRGETDERLLQRIVRNVILEFFDDNNFKLECIRENNINEWILLLGINDALEMLQQKLKLIQKYFKETMHFGTCFYVGNIESIGNIVLHYDQFELFCDEMLFEEDGIIEQKNWEDLKEGHIKLPNFENKLNQLLNSEVQQVIVELEAYVKSLVSKHQATRIVFKEVRKYIEKILELFLAKNNLDFEFLYDKEQYLHISKEAEISIVSMNNYIHYVFGRIEELEEKNDRKKQIVEFIKSFVAGHIGEDLTRKMLAQSIHFSEDYIARIFKAETGKSVSTYVMEQRMEFAKQYLTESSLSISEIAIRVGYNNFSYFSKTFKDYTGKTPNEFRICVKST